MELTYDGTLVMPTSFVTMDNEEMVYTDGGGFYLNANVCGTITTHINNICKVNAVVLAISALEKVLKKAAKTIAKWIVKVCSSFGSAVGFIIGCIGAAVIALNIFTFCGGVVTADKKNTGVYMNWYGAGFYNLSYY